MDGSDGKSAGGAAADEIKSFVDRFERLDENRQEVVKQQKEVMDEAKGRGYDVKALKKVIAMRRRDRDELAEEEALIEVYRDAIGF